MKLLLRAARLPEITTDRLLLREVTLADISPEYIYWLNDPETVQFLEIRHSPQTRTKIEDFLTAKLQDTSSTYHFGIFLPLGPTSLFIGTVTVNDINVHHKRGEISFIIGHPQAKHKGYAAEAVHAICAYLFLYKQFHRITGGHCQANKGSEKIFLKNGFSIEGTYSQHVLNASNQWEDVIRYGLLKDSFIPNATLLGDNGTIFCEEMDSGKQYQVFSAQESLTASPKGT